MLHPGLDFKKLVAMELAAPWKPTVSSKTDVSQFEPTSRSTRATTRATRTDQLGQGLLMSERPRKTRPANARAAAPACRAGARAAIDRERARRRRLHRQGGDGREGGEPRRLKDARGCPPHPALQNRFAAALRAQSTRIEAQQKAFSTSSSLQRRRAGQGHGLGRVQNMCPWFRESPQQSRTAAPRASRRSRSWPSTSRTSTSRVTQARKAGGLRS